jgi:hypothetical protein
MNPALINSVQAGAELAEFGHPVERFGAAVVQVVDDNHVMTGTDHHQTGVAANEASPSSDQYRRQGP